MTIPKKQLGKTGIEVSILGFGGATLGDEYGTIDAAEGAAACALAIDRGINYFDVAPYYGRTLAETRLGEALIGRRDEVVISTKCCRYDVDGFDFSRDRILASIDESLARLRCEHVDVLFAHDVEFGDPKQVLDETIPALHEVKASGKARAIGFSGLPTGYLRMLAEKSEVDVILSYGRFNLLCDDAGSVLAPLLQSRGIGLVNASPLHLGILTGEAAPPWHPAPDEIKTLGTELGELCREHGSSIVDVALPWVFAQEAIDTTLVGMKTRAQVEQNVALVNATLDQDLLALVQERIGDAKNTHWPQGRPENNY